MERVHRIFDNGNRQFKEFLDRAQIGHKYEESIVGKTVFLLISESDPKWPQLAEYLASDPSVHHSIELRFSKREITDAPWCELGVTSHFGYPQPEVDWHLSTYESSTYCHRCGIHPLQVNPFRFRSEPKAKRSQFLQLNWAFDEFFVRPEVRTAFEQEAVSGIQFRPAVHHKSGRSLETVQQLAVLDLLPPSLVVNTAQTVTCKPNNEEDPIDSSRVGRLRYPPDYPYCGRVKYVFKGEVPAFCYSGSGFANAPDFVKSFEWFGSGAAAFRQVFVSQRVVGLIQTKKWRGLGFRPVLFDDRSAAEYFSRS
jgi:hypothetical protein